MVTPRTGTPQRLPVIRARILSGLVVTAVLFVLAFAGGWPLAAGLAIATLVVVHEITHALAFRGHRPPFLLAALVGLACLAGAQAGGPFALAGLAVAVLGMLIAPRLGLHRGLDAKLAGLTGLYVGSFLAYSLLIRPLPQGFEWLLLVFWGIGAADVSAYAVGSLFGRRKLAPAISPGKTWEGLAGGLVGCTLVVVLLNTQFGLFQLWLAPIIGFVLAICDLTGDLLASALKRYSGTKDFGRLIPGHGGLLDRLDGLLFALPVAHALIRIIVAAG